MAKMSGSLAERRKQVEARLHNWYPNLEILTHYVGAQSKMKFRCKRCGNIFERKALALMYEGTRPRYGCPKCDVRLRANGTVLPLKLALEKIHGRFPDIEYVGGYTTFSKPATFKCRNCEKTFERLPKQFMVSRSGCPYCVHKVWGSNRRKSPEQYQKEFSAKFPNLKLLTPYVNGRTNVKVKCNVCGNIWSAKPNALLRMKFGCKVCSSNHRGFGDRKSQKEFWTNLKKVNPTILPLELYQGNKVPILVKCKVCGNHWKARPNNLLTRTGGCGICGIVKSTYARANFSKVYQKIRKKLPHESYQHYLQAAYAYVFYQKHHDAQLLTLFEGDNKRVKVRCLKCGNIRSVSAIALLTGSPACLACEKSNGYYSKGERAVASLLMQADIHYQYPFVSDDLVDRYPLHYDFRVNGKYLIEYQGEQHYRAIDWYGGKRQLDYQRRHDQMKRNWAKKNGFVLIEIKYSDSVKDKLGRYLPKVLNYEPKINSVPIHRVKRVHAATHLNKQLFTEFESLKGNKSFSNLMNMILVYMKQHRLDLVRPEYQRTKDSKVKSVLLSEESYKVYQRYRSRFNSGSEELRTLLHSYYLAKKQEEANNGNPTN